MWARDFRNVEGCWCNVIYDIDTNELITTTINLDKSFVDNIISEHNESLRKCAMHIQKCK